MRTLFSMALCLLPMIPDADPTGGGGGGGSTDLLDVEIMGGQKVKMSKEGKAAYETAAAKNRQERDSMAELAKEATANRTKAADAEAARILAENQAAALKAARDGDIKKATDLLTAESDKRLRGLTASTVRATIRAAAVAKLPGLDAIAYDDIVQATTPSCRFNHDTGAVEFLDPAGQQVLQDSAGKPLGADAFIEAYAKDRKHLQPAHMPPGDGVVTSGRRLAPVLTGTITMAQYNHAMETGDRATIDAFQAGKVQIKD